jgi:hypothetical protein
MLSEAEGFTIWIDKIEQVTAKESLVYANTSTRVHCDPFGRVLWSDTQDGKGNVVTIQIMLDVQG